MGDEPIPLNTGNTGTTTFARRLTLFDATMIVISGIIGSGIFINPYVVAQTVKIRSSSSRSGSPGVSSRSSAPSSSPS